MIPPGVVISHHSYWRFITRYQIYKGELPPCPMAEFNRLMSLAKQVDLGAGAVQRILDNHETAAYFEYDGWRFVLDESLQRLITIERILIGRKPPKKLHKRRTQKKGDSR